MGFSSNVKTLWNKAVQGGNDLFRKGTIGGTKLFGKGSAGSKMLGSVSKGLSNLSGIASGAGSLLGHITNNPITAGFASMIPGGLGALEGASAVGAGLGTLGAVANSASGLTRQKNYSGDTGNVVNSVLERAKEVHDNSMKFV